MKFVRISQIKQIFPNWSHGTLYNRLSELGIKDNAMYMSSNKSLYNEEAIQLLAKKYLEEYTENSTEDKQALDKIITSILSNQETSKETKKNKNDSRIKNDKVDNVDTNDNNDNVNNVNSTYINNNYILKELHFEIVNSLKEQNEILKEQLQQANDINQKLVESMNIRDETNLVSEKKELYQLEKERGIKVLESQEQKEAKKRRGLFSLFNRNS